MRILKLILNLFGILAATVLSLLLVVTLITTPVVSATSSFLQAESLHKVIENIDFSEMLGETLKEGDMDGELLNELMETELIEEMLALYIEDVFAALDGKNEQVNLTPEALKKLMNEHMDELLPIMKAYIGTEYPLSDEDLSRMIGQMLESGAADFVAMFPSVEELGLDESVITAVRSLRAGTVIKILLGVTAVLSLLIVLCRFVRFKGFMWLGVVYFCSAALVFITALFVKSSEAALIAAAVSAGEMIVAPVLTVLTTEMFKGAGIIAALAVVFIVVGVLGGKTRRKKDEILKAA